MSSRHIGMYTWWNDILSLLTSHCTHLPWHHRLPCIFRVPHWRETSLLRKKWYYSLSPWHSLFLFFIPAIREICILVPHTSLFLFRPHFLYSHLIQTLWSSFLLFCSFSFWVSSCRSLYLLFVSWTHLPSHIYFNKPILTLLSHLKNFFLRASFHDFFFIVDNTTIM